MKENLRPLLAKLKLRGIDQVLDAEIERAQREGSPIPEVIYRLLVEEDRYREERSLDHRLKKAKIPRDWTLQTFPFESKPDQVSDSNPGRPFLCGTCSKCRLHRGPRHGQNRTRNRSAPPGHSLGISLPFLQCPGSPRSTLCFPCRPLHAKTDQDPLPLCGAFD